MKIFSLETKKHLVGWSLGLGVLINFIFEIFTHRPYTATYSPGLGQYTLEHIFESYSGFPFTVWHKLENDSWSWIIPAQSSQLILYISNFIFWIIIVLIILSLIRHFKYSKANFIATNNYQPPTIN